MFVLNVPPTAKVIWRRGHGLKSHPTDLWSQESNLRPLIYKASSSSTTPRWLLIVSCIGKFFQPLDNIQRVASLARNRCITSTWWVFFDLLSCCSHIALYVTIFPWVLCKLYLMSLLKKTGFRLLSVLRRWFCCCWLFVYCYSHCGSL